MQWSKGQRERERVGERHPEQEPGREGGRRGGNVLTRRFLSELPKLIISSGLGQQCQEQELLPGQAGPGRAGQGQALPRYHRQPPPALSPLTPFPSLSPCSNPSSQPSSGGRIGNRLPARPPALPVRAEPSLARCHGAFACSGVLIKSFIVFHSRKELRRNTEQNGAEG